MSSLVKLLEPTRPFSMPNMPPRPPFFTLWRSRRVTLRLESELQRSDAEGPALSGQTRQFVLPALLVRLEQKLQERNQEPCYKQGLWEPLPGF